MRGQDASFAALPPHSAVRLRPHRERDYKLEAEPLFHARDAEIESAAGKAMESVSKTPRCGKKTSGRPLITVRGAIATAFNVCKAPGRKNMPNSKMNRVCCSGLHGTGLTNWMQSLSLLVL